MRRDLAGLAVLFAAVVFTGCVPAGQGLVAEPQALPRRLDPAYAVTPETRELHLLVLVYGPCPPPAEAITSGVEFRTAEIAVSVIEPYHGSCLTGDYHTELAVHLSEPVGNRRIVSQDQPEPSFGLYSATFLRDHGATRPSSGDPGYMSQEQLGAAWPLTVPYGAVSCAIAGSALVVLFAGPDGTLYHANGELPGELQLPPIEDIWLPGSGAQRAGLQPIIDRGLGLCE